VLKIPAKSAVADLPAALPPIRCQFGQFCGIISRLVVYLQHEEIMDPLLIFSIVSTLATAVWSVWTWREQQEKERQVKRDQESALFVNSFIQAMEELQSRLYRILEEDDLAFAKKEYPEPYEFGSPFAVEVLYRLSKYCGWVYYTFRYGPYTNDATVIELVRKISEAFENRHKFPGDAFRFTYEERVAVGETVVQRTGEMLGYLPVFESVTLFEYQEQMRDYESKFKEVFQSKPVRRTLEAIDRADRPEALEGVERLRVMQNLLVDLVGYLETREGFTVSTSRRRKVRLTEIAVESRSCLIIDAAIVHQIPGRLRLKIPCLQTDESCLLCLQSLLESLDHIKNFQIKVKSASLVIEHDPAIPANEYVEKLRHDFTKQGIKLRI
jgi:Heavy metal associated domain 2